MLSSGFTPGQDGQSDWELPPSENLPDWQLKPVFLQARAQALDGLHAQYFDAVEIYDLAHHTARWIEQAARLVCADDAGKLYLSLDYFSCNLPLPRHLHRLSRKKAALFRRYLDRRSLDNLAANLPGLLQALAILSLIPDAWFPQKNLENLIEDKIHRLGLYRQIEVDVNLNLPPGGMRWISHTTRQAVAQVQEALALGQPCLVRLLRSLERLEANRQAIVYAVGEAPGNALRLEIFEPDCVLEEHALQVTVRGERAEVLEIAPPSRPQPVLGLLYDVYSPVAPPQECIPWLLRSPVIRQLWRNISS
jgi:hypothetical protein